MRPALALTLALTMIAFTVLCALAFAWILN